MKFQIIKKPSRDYWRKDDEQELYEAILEGNLDMVKQQVTALNFNINAPVKGNCNFNSS